MRRKTPVTLCLCQTLAKLYLFNLGHSKKSITLIDCISCIVQLSFLQISFFYLFSSRILEFCLCEINSAVTIDWWLRFFHYHVVYRGWLELLNNPAPRFKWHNSWATDQTRDRSRQPLCTPLLHESPRWSIPSKRNILEQFSCLGKYFEYVCCFIGQDSFQFGSIWFYLVLLISTRFMPIGRITFKCPSNSILQSKFLKSTHFFLYLLSSPFCISSNGLWCTYLHPIA